MIRKSNFRWLIIGVVIIALFFGILHLFVSQENVLQEKTISILSVGQVIENYISPLREWFNDFFHFNQLRQTVKEIQEENLRLLTEEAMFRQLQKENDLLRDTLQVKKEEPWHLILAHVIFTDPTNLKGTFWIDKGSAAGLAKGMNVVIRKKVLIGRLEKCFPSFCEAVSILQPGSRLSVKDERSSTLAIAEKGSGGRFYLKLVSAEADVSKGDILITSKENADFLPGLLVARVGEEQSPPANFLKEFSLEPLFEKVNVSSVLVITNFQGK